MAEFSLLGRTLADMIINTLKGLLSMTKYGIEKINVGFGINYLPSEHITNFPSKNDEIVLWMSLPH